MAIHTYYGLAVLRCPETYRHIAEHLGYSLFLGRRSRLCEFGKHLRFESRAEAEDWVAAFYSRGSNRRRYELEVIEVREEPGVSVNYGIGHVTVFSSTAHQVEPRSTRSDTG